MPKPLPSCNANPSAQAQRFTQLCAAAAFGIALLAATGWLVNVPFLAGQSGEAIPMAPSTALAFLLLSGGVFIHACWPTHRLTRTIGLAAAGLPALLGLLILAQFFAGFDSGVERMLSATSEVLGQIPLGRMSPLTAMSFLLESGALALLFCATPWRFAAAGATLLALAPTAMNTMFIVGYCYGVPLLYGGPMIPVSLPAALAFVLIGTGQIRLAAPGVAALRPWGGNTMRGVLLRGFLPATLAVIFLEGFLDTIQPAGTVVNAALWDSVTTLLAGAMIVAVTAWTARRTGDVIERATEALEKSRSLLAETQRIGNVGGWEFDIDTQEQVWTEEVYRIHEVDSTYKPTVGEGVSFYTPASRPIIERAVQRAIEHGEPFDVELEIITAKGNLRWVHAIGKADLARRRVIGFFQDTTRRKRAEEALRESEERLRLALAGTNQGLFDCNLQTSVAAVSPEYIRMLGYEPGEVDCDVDWWRRQLHPDDQERATRTMGECVQGTRTGYSMEYRLKTKNGNWKWISSIGKVVECDAQGRPLRMLGTHVDITERKRAEEHLHVMAQLADSAPASITVHDLEGHFLYANQQTLALHGYTREEFFSLNLHQLDVPESEALIQSRIEALLETGTIDFDVQHFRKDGSRIPLHVSARMIEWQGKSALLSIASDLTERLHAEAALRESEVRYSTILRTAMDGFWLTDTQGRLLEVNEAYCRISGYSAEELLTMRVPDLEALETASDTAARILEILAQGESRFESRHRRKDGSLVDLEVSVQHRPNNGGQLVAFLHDITQRKRAEAERNSLQLQLAQAQKMESIGRLAGGVAHDFNNQLNVIMGYSGLALRGLRPGDPRSKSLTEVQKAAEKAADLTRQLLAFSRRQVLQPRVLDLNSVVGESEKMLGRLIGEDISLEVVRGSGLGLVKADPNQIDQIIMNLAVNSRDAMFQGGKLTIETANAEMDAAFLRLNPGARRGRYVVLAVRDTGIGMDKETQDRVFEPFFTTKDVGKGTGLGLAMVYGIVKQSDGYITVHSEPGQGTEFKIYLPRVFEPSEPVVAPEAAPMQSGVETIMVAEDEPSMRALVCKFLEDAGYRVLAARDVKDAIQIATQHEGPLDLLLTDVVMPDLSGPQLAQHLQPLRPEMKVVYMSGYPNVHEANSALEPTADFIQKPFTQEKLLHRLREVLEGR